MGPILEVLHVPDCPNLAPLLARLRAVTDLPVTTREITNAADAAKLADPTFRDAVAEAVVVAVQRLYLPADQDADTGFLRLPLAPAPLSR